MSGNSEKIEELSEQVKELTRLLNNMGDQMIFLMDCTMHDQV